MSTKPCLTLARYGHCSRKQCDFYASHSWSTATLKARSLCKYENNCRNDDCPFLHNLMEFTAPRDKNQGKREVPGSQSKAQKNAPSASNNKTKAKGPKYPEWTEEPGDLEKEVKESEARLAEAQAKLARAKLEAKLGKSATKDKAKPGRGLAHHGMIAYKDKDLALAIKLFTQAMGTNKLSDNELVAILYNRATANFEVYAYDCAWKDTIKVLNIKPNHFKCVRLQARVRAKEDKFKDAEKLYATAIAMAENKDMVFVFDCLNELEEYNERVQARRAAMEEAEREKRRNEAAHRAKAEKLKKAQGDRVWLSVQHLTFYEFLQIPQSSTSSAIKRAYHVALRKYHTDRVDSPLCSTKVTQVLFEVGRVLLDEDLRYRYDRTLHTLEEM